MSTVLTALALIAATPGLLVSPAELAAALRDPGTVVIAVGTRQSDFEAAHIPGARFLRYNQLAVDGDGLGSELPPLVELRAVIAAAGVSERSAVVIYGAPLGAARLFFTLDYLGHPNVRLLNGGFEAWKAHGGAIETGPPARVAAAAALTSKPRSDAVVGAEWIAARLESPRMTLLDARPDAEFAGTDGGMGGAHAIGHIPGARQLVWTTLVDDRGQFLPDAALREHFESIGADPATPVVSYCMVGMRASVTYFVARHLGFDARLYDGSIVDWTRRKLPVRTGR